MQALAIVTCTLLGFAVLLFGSDHLDRRLTLRSQAPVPEPATPARPTVTTVIDDDADGAVGMPLPLPDAAAAAA